MSNHEDEPKIVDSLILSEEWLDDLDLASFDDEEALNWNDDLVSRRESVNLDAESGMLNLRDGITLEPVNVHLEQERVLKMSREKSADELDFETQVLHYLSLIFLRLCDDLELIFIQGHSFESIDLAKQINRLGNALTILKLEEHLPFLAYLYHLLPVAHAETKIGDFATLEFQAWREPDLIAQKTELINSIRYLLQQIERTFTQFDASRFYAVIYKLDTALGIEEAPPSSDAPLAATGSVNPKVLTTRTISKLARTMEALMAESIHYIESAALYGYSTGYREAAHCLSDASQVAQEFNLEDLRDGFKHLSSFIAHLHPKEKPSQELYGFFEESFVKLKKHFPHLLLEKKLRHLYGVISRFTSLSKPPSQNESFDSRWKQFHDEVSPILNQILDSGTNEENALMRLFNASVKYKIKWLTTIFSTFDKYWKSFPDSSLEAFLILVHDIRAFPTEDVMEEDLKKLANDKLRILFERKSSQRNLTPFILAQNAESFYENLMKSIETPKSIQREALQNLIIDARLIKCHVIMRVGEILDVFIEILNESDNMEKNREENLIDALFFSSELLRKGILFVKRICQLDLDYDTLSSPQHFFDILLSMYRAEGFPSDPVSKFILKKLNDTISELQLVWINTSTPSSTDYYCTRLSRLLHIATTLELSPLREKILEHLNEIPNQDFINTANASLHRQHLRLIRAVTDSVNLAHGAYNDELLRSFFSRLISACNFYASSNSDSKQRASDIQRLDTSIFDFAKQTLHPSAIALALELKSLSRSNSLQPEHLNNFLLWSTNVAHNACPSWTSEQALGLDYVNLPISIPMTSFLRLHQSIQRLFTEIQPRAKDFPSVWDALSMLQDISDRYLQAPEYLLNNIATNAKNRSAYLKKSVDIVTSYSAVNEQAQKLSQQSPAHIHAIIHCIEKIVELLLSHAFHSSNISSRIEINLCTQKNSITAAVSHNGDHFTTHEINQILQKLKLIPAPDDDLFDLLTQAKKLYKLYPPVTHIAYFLPIIRQFNARIDISTIEKTTYISLEFPFS